MGLLSILTNLILAVGIAQIAKHIPMTDPFVLNTVRGLFALTHVFIALVHIYVYIQISKKHDSTHIRWPAPKGGWWRRNNTDKLLTTTIHDYDTRQLREAVRGQVVIIALASFLHFYLKLAPPILVQSVLPLKNTYWNPLVQVHAFGQLAIGDFKRPF